MHGAYIYIVPCMVVSVFVCARRNGRVQTKNFIFEKNTPKEKDGTHTKMKNSKTENAPLVKSNKWAKGKETKTVSIVDIGGESVKVK